MFKKLILFLLASVGFGSASAAVKKLGKSLNIPMDAFAGKPSSTPKKSTPSAAPKALTKSTDMTKNRPGHTPGLRRPPTRRQRTAQTTDDIKSKQKTVVVPDPMTQSLPFNFSMSTFATSAIGSSPVIVEDPRSSTPETNTDPVATTEPTEQENIHHDLGELFESAQREENPIVSTQPEAKKSELKPQQMVGIGLTLASVFGMITKMQPILQRANKKTNPGNKKQSFSEFITSDLKDPKNKNQYRMIGMTILTALAGLLIAWTAK